MNNPLTAFSPTVCSEGSELKIEMKSEAKAAMNSDHIH
jgi:hypothetical protein